MKPTTVLLLRPQPIEDGIRDYRAIGGTIGMPFWLVVKAEALYLGDRIPEALEALKQSEALAERSAERWWCAELHRLRAVFLIGLGADEIQIEASFAQAIRTAEQQKSSSLAMRAERSCAEYHGRKGRDQNLLGCSG